MRLAVCLVGSIWLVSLAAAAPAPVLEDIFNHANHGSEDFRNWFSLDDAAHGAGPSSDWHDLEGYSSSGSNEAGPSHRAPPYGGEPSNYAHPPVWHPTLPHSPAAWQPNEAGPSTPRRVQPPPPLAITPYHPPATNPAIHHPDLNWLLSILSHPQVPSHLHAGVPTAPSSPEAALALSTHLTLQRFPPLSGHAPHPSDSRSNFLFTTLGRDRLSAVEPMTGSYASDSAPLLRLHHPFLFLSHDRSFLERGSADLYASTQMERDYVLVRLFHDFRQRRLIEEDEYARFLIEPTVPPLERLTEVPLRPLPPYWVDLTHPSCPWSVATLRSTYAYNHRGASDANPMLLAGPFRGYIVNGYEIRFHPLEQNAYYVTATRTDAVGPSRVVEVGVLKIDEGNRLVGEFSAATFIRQAAERQRSIEGKRNGYGAIKWDTQREFERRGQNRG